MTAVTGAWGGPETQESERLLDQAERSESLEEAEALITQAMNLQLVGALKAARVSKAQQAVEDLKEAGLDRLLLESWMEGKVSYKEVSGHIERLRKKMSTLEDAEIIKQGILTFDTAAQHLAMLQGPEGHQFEYPLKNNRARDSLTTFARALHR